MSRPPNWPRAGLTLVELLIYVAVISVCLAGLHSWLTNFSVRQKIAEAVACADSAKKAIVIACTENPSIRELKRDLIGYSLPISEYMESISLGGSCAAPVITIATIKTGLLVDPTLTITGGRSEQDGQMEWVCTSDGLEVHVPASCRD